MLRTDKSPSKSPEGINSHTGQEAAANDTRTQKQHRHCEMMKYYFLDHYLDLLSYIDGRNNRQCKVEATAKALPINEKCDEWNDFIEKEHQLLRSRRTRLRITDFQIIKQIGQGGYGQVFLTRKKDTEEICALKKMSKALLQRMGETTHILTERDILSRTNSPWLVKLLYAFQDIDHVYLAMEYIPGGDFRTLLNASGVLHENHAQFYFAEMAAAVFELHKLGYIHRDLKPENFLLDASGHVKLTDFGLSRGSLSNEFIEIMKSKLEMVKSSNGFSNLTISQRYNTYQTVKKENRGFSLVGSPDYMAIEVLVGEGKTGYDLSVDYWSLGCILFEALCGFPPFTAKTTDKVWVNLYNWEKVLERPVYEGEDEEFNLSDDSWDMISNLITHAESRYRQPSQIQNHPFLKHLKFSELRTPNKYKVPLVPILRSETDTAYFDDFSNPNDMAQYSEIRKKERNMLKSISSKVNQKDFVGFTFKHS